MLVIHSSDECLLEVLKESSSFPAYALFQTFDWEETATNRNRWVNTARFSFDIWLWANFIDEDIYSLTMYSVGFESIQKYHVTCTTHDYLNTLYSLKRK